MVFMIVMGSGVMSQKIWGGTIFARERPSPRERSDRAGEGVGGGGGVPPPTLGSFFNFRLENVQSGAYLYIRRKFRLDDMYYMGISVSRLDRSGKGYIFHELGNIIMQICTPRPK